MIKLFNGLNNVRNRPLYFIRKGWANTRNNRVQKENGCRISYNKPNGNKSRKFIVG